MNIERVKLGQALAAVGEGREVYLLTKIDKGTLFTFEELLAMEFAMEKIPEPLVGGEIPPRKVKLPSLQLPALKRSWTMERSRHCTMQAGPMRRSQTRWDAQLAQWIPA